MARTAIDRKWLSDCGWCGWLEDLLTGEVVTHHGDAFASVTELRGWLESLPKWPRVRNVPKK